MKLTKARASRRLHQAPSGIFTPSGVIVQTDTGDSLMTTRRDFLERASLTVAGAAVLGSFHTNALAQAGSGTMLKRTIPASGEAIPAIGMGTSGSFEIAPNGPEYQALKEV